MKNPAIALAVAALTLLACPPAQAQTVNDDVRCFLLSTGFARQAKEEKTRSGAALTAAFFLGRLDGRVPRPALAAAIRKEGNGMPVAQAGPLMRACAARAAAAQGRLEAAGKEAGPAK